VEADGEEVKGILEGTEAQRDENLEATSDGMFVEVPSCHHVVGFEAGTVFETMAFELADHEMMASDLVDLEQWMMTHLRQGGAPR